MGKSIKSQSNCGRAVGATMVAPTPCDSMSLQLVIPRRVALQQSPLPLHQLAATLPQGRGTWQSPTRRYLNTNLTRGLTSGGHPSDARKTVETVRSLLTWRGPPG